MLIELISFLSLPLLRTSSYADEMQPTYFINHGGGPCFFLVETHPMRTAWQELEDYLRKFADTLSEKPRAVLVISGHWEESRPTVNAGASPGLDFDYGGFPDYTYQLTWPAPGSPSLASRVRELLNAAGIDSSESTTRGWDHGVFVPLKVIFPGAELPVVQLSLQRGLDPKSHLRIGRALNPLRSEGVLIVGSGQSFHNLHSYMRDGRGIDPMADAFDEWLRQAMLDGSTREQALIRWEEAPGARHAQPYEDHLIPLLVAAGAASGEPGRVDFHGYPMNRPLSGFRFG